MNSRRFMLSNDHWIVDAVGALHVGERSEKELIKVFVNRIANSTLNL